MKQILIDSLNIGIDLNPEQKQWIAKVVAGAVVADGVVKDVEKPHLRSLYELVGDDAEARKIVNDTYLSGETPSVEPIIASPEFAIDIYRIVLQISACDLELHPREIRYIGEIGEILNIPVDERNRLFKNILRQMRLDSFVSIMKKLEQTDRFWMASVICKVIYADGIVEKREMDFISHVYDLLEDNPDHLNAIKNNMHSIDLNSLPDVSFSPELSIQICRYLAQIIIARNALEEKGLAVVLEIGDLLGIPEEELDKITDYAEVLSTA